MRQCEGGAKAVQAGRGGAGRDAALAPALKLKPGAFGFMADALDVDAGRKSRTAGGAKV